MLPDDLEDEPEPAAEEPEPVQEPEAQPGGELGAAVAAALQAALERTGQVPPTPHPAGPPGSAPPPVSAEPLDLLDTSSAPWLHDPELGVQWAASWIASHPADEPVAEPEPALEPHVEPEPMPEPAVEFEPLAVLPFTLAAEPPVPEPVAPPPAAQLPAAQPLAVTEPAAALPAVPPARITAETPPPTPPVTRRAPPAPPADRGSSLAPWERPYEPRSLDVLFGRDAAAHAALVQERSRALMVPEERTSEPEPAVLRTRRRAAFTRLDWTTALLIGLVIGLMAGLVAYAVGPAVHDVYLTRYDVPVNDLPAPLVGLRIVQVSDLHLPGGAATADSAARLVVRAKPDVLLLTGDLVDDASPASLAALARFLATARGAQGTFAVLGEREVRLRGQLQLVYEASGVRLLTNERATVAVGDARLVIAGFDGPPRRLLELAPVSAGSEDAMAEALRPRVQVWMVHAPQVLTDVPRSDLKEAAFVVAGHTLGGTLGLPSLFGGETRYRSGWYNLDLTRLYVSNGVGTGRIPARLLAPAEVTRFTLRRATEPYATPSRDTSTD
jgi:predicted MPP superfamily phosphohydrolase